MTPHPKLSRLTPPERVTAALMAVGGIRGLLAAVKTSGHNANSRRAYVGAFDALADAVAEAEREAFQRGQEEMLEAAAQCCLTSLADQSDIRDLPILDAPTKMAPPTPEMTDEQAIVAAARKYLSTTFSGRTMLEIKLNACNLTMDSDGGGASVTLRFGVNLDRDEARKAKEKA